MRRWKIALCALLFGLSSAHAAEKMMLVLDASGSMWGQIQGKTKIEIARETVAALLQDWRPEDELGLEVYGHRSKGDCKDIEVMIPVGPLSKETFLTTVNALNPKGMTPISDSVIAAAEALKFTEQKSTVILVSDGEETCNRNPCEVARELEARGVEFTAHVVGFDVGKPEHQAQLRCLAENTGGKYFTARNAAELKQALRTAVQVTKKAPENVPGNGAVFSMSLAENTLPIAASADLSWFVFKPGTDPANVGEQVAFSYDSVWKSNVGNGNYVVEANLGNAKKRVMVEVKQPLQKVHVVLGAGVVKATAQRAQGSNQLDKDVIWNVIDKNTGNKIAFSYDPAPQWTLPAGAYRVEALMGEAKASGEVTVTAGQESKVDLSLASGTLRAKAFFSQNGTAPKSDVVWDVFKTQKQVDGSREKVGFSYDAEPSWELPAGNYYVEATVGFAKAGAEAAVQANQTANANVILNAGSLQLSTNRGGDHVWDIYANKADMQGNRVKAGFSYEQKPRLILPAGHYLVEVRVGGELKVVEVDVQAEQLTEQALNY